MEQVAYVLVFAVVVALCGLWWFALRKLYPLYKGGRIEDGWRAAFQFVIVALSWLTMHTILWLLLRQDTAAMLLSVLWAVGLLSWLTLSTVARTRRQVLSETPRAQPERGRQPASRPAGKRQPVKARPDISGYTVRAAPARSASNVRSARVRRIQAMEE